MENKNQLLTWIYSLYETNRYGYWGICFLYGTMFVIGGLTAAGKTFENSEAIGKAVNFYLSTQNEEGGWGECLESCPSMVSSTYLNFNDSYYKQKGCQSNLFLL